MSLLQKINLFLDEEKKPADDISNGRPKDLLSLVQGGVHVSRRIATKHMPSNFPFRIPELVDRHVISNLTSPGIENSEEWCNVNDVKPAIGPALLTCEDFEKSILSESTEIYPNFLVAASLCIQDVRLGAYVISALLPYIITMNDSIIRSFSCEYINMAAAFSMCD
ncbi:Uncharacterized protein TCM_005587 [Theobroma cacao]|uniref:Uncharacterized protein n=1 Tax=Theobroma cacao TaxID=3641 RepID=A0A061E218_THECC|nr:Uncharacterized protein TCM_005587 [Theobroma cacao]